MATLVKFLHDKTGGIYAYFPQLNHSFNGYRPDLKTCYSSIGQHSGCAPEYAKECRAAVSTEYNDLKSELESMGYILKVLNKS